MSEGNPILDAKMRLSRLRAEFDARKEREWAEVQARAQAALEDAVWSAKHEHGKSVYAIAQDYGTTNRNTIYAILQRAEAAREILKTDEPEPTRYTWESTPTANEWDVTDTRTGAKVRVDVVRHRLVAGDPSNRAWGLALHNNPDHEVWSTRP